MTPRLGRIAFACGAGELCSPRNIAGGFGNPVRVPILIVASLAVLTASACIDENVLDQMADSQPKANRYRESKFYADGLTMKFRPVTIDENPRMKMPTNAGNAVIGVVVLYGG